MRLAILFDHRFYCSDERGLYSLKNYTPSFFQSRYLTTFSSVNIVARVDDDIPRIVPWGDKVDLTLVGDWRSVGGWLRRRSHAIRMAKEAVMSADAVIVIAPSLLADAIFPTLRKKGYSVEVVSDPFQTLQRGSIKHWARPILQIMARNSLSRLCLNSQSASYVTRFALQHSYPGGTETRMFACSDVDLRDDSFVENPKIVSQSQTQFVICNIGTMVVNYKRQDLLIRCVARLRSRGFDVRCRLVGDGRFRTEFCDLARSLGVGDYVEFCGVVPAGAGVRSKLEQSDLFVLPSMQEGLPRALVEAMACGLPCIASDVGGVGELLPKDSMCIAGSLDSLVECVESMICSVDRMNFAASRNLKVAREFHDSELSVKRLEFYQCVAERSRSFGTRYAA